MFSRDAEIKKVGRDYLLSLRTWYRTHFFFHSLSHHYSIWSRGTAGWWLVWIQFPDLLFINCPCFIYILILGVIFPHWNRMEPSLPESIYPQTLTHSEWARDVTSQWSRLLWRVSPKQLGTVMCENLVETVAKSFSLLSLKWLVSELWLLAYKVGI